MDVLDLVRQGKIKRFFRARNKIALKGGVYHITQRAVGREPLFLEESDFLYALYLIKEKSKKFNFEVFSFVLMLNHIHILLKLGNEDLPIAMKNLFECYARYFNKKYERKGHLFCGPYRSAMCFDDTYLLAASLYIHLNPVKGKIVKDPSKYRWSSCSLFLNTSSQKTFLNKRFILEILDDDIVTACNKYAKLLEDLGKGAIEDCLRNVKALEIFRCRVVEAFVKRFGLPKEEDVKENFLLDARLDDEIERLKRKKRLRTAQDIKARKFVIEQLISRGFDISDIEVKLCLSRTNIYRTLRCNK